MCVHTLESPRQSTSRLLLWLWGEAAGKSRSIFTNLGLTRMQARGIYVSKRGLTGIWG
jgi:hypothetical protein